MRTLAGFTVLALSLAASAQETTDKVTLAWKLKKGDSHRYEVSQENKTEFGGMEINNEVIFGYVMEVSEVSDKGVATLKLTYDRIKFVMTGMMDTEYDSDKDKAAPEEGLGKVMAGLVGKSFTMKLSARGEVVSVKGYEDIIAEITKDMGEDDPMLQQMKQQMTDTNVKKLLQQAFPRLPEKGVSKGDTWEDSSDMGIPGFVAVTMKNKTTFKEQKGGEVTLDIEGKYEQKDDAGGNGGQVQVTDGKLKSAVTWDTEKGIMTGSKGTTTMSAQAGGQEFTTESKTSVKLMPKKDPKKK